MNFIKKIVGTITGKDSKYGWVFGGEMPSAENRVGNFLNNVTGSSDMLNKEYANNVSLWNMQNEYNSPAAQIARMKAAGIDVNPMTYAVGNGSMSSTASNISAPSVGASGINPIATLMSVIGGLSSIKNQSMQLDNVLKNDVVNRRNTTSEIEARDVSTALARKDLEFYKKHGYRPGTNSPFTLIPSFFDNNFNHSFKIKGVGEGNPETDVIVYDKSKPALGDNVKSVPKNWRPRFW